jgi:hypothetical protein
MNPEEEDDEAPTKGCDHHRGRMSQKHLRNEVRDLMSPVLLFRYYIGYKELKKKIKELRPRRATITEDEMGELIREFAELLDYQVFADFHHRAASSLSDISETPTSGCAYGSAIHPNARLFWFKELDINRTPYGECILGREPLSNSGSMA